MGLARADYYRISGALKCEEEKPVRKTSRRALSKEERDRVLLVLNEERFMNKPPSAVYATLLDEGVYICSIRTMYRILKENQAVKERRNQLRHPEYKKPELLATGPNQVWSWDITKLKGPEKWTKYYLYVILDIYSRYAVGWMIATKESAELAKLLISETCDRQGVQKDKLIIHSDRGPSMTSKAVALLLSDLGVTKSLNRPYVSNDNPFSESQFKTLKYQPEFPERFGCLEDARNFCTDFFDWYNNYHFHTGLALMPPGKVHYGLAEACNERRTAVLKQAFAKTPERFINGEPKGLKLPDKAWINKPKTEEERPALVATTCNGTIIGGVR